MASCAGRWRRGWPWGLAALAGAIVGTATARFATAESAIERVPSHPAWSIDRLAGAESAGLHARARIARIGLLALNREEAMYYIADRDADGRRLREDCRYRIGGGALPGRWWSLTVYADDRFLARNADQAHSLGAAGLSHDADGAWRVALGPDREPGAPWLSTRGTGAPSLALRLYRPHASLREDPMQVALPRIERIGCAAERPS